MTWLTHLFLLLLLLCLQSKSISGGNIDVKLKELRDYFMTDAISRASPTMAKCISAVNKQQREDEAAKQCVAN